jgi:hypothetical protein
MHNDPFGDEETLMMEKTRSSKTLVSIYKTIRLHNLEYHNRNAQHCENFKSCNMK